MMSANAFKMSSMACGVQTTRPGQSFYQVLYRCLPPVTIKAAVGPRVRTHVDNLQREGLVYIPISCDISILGISLLTSTRAEV